MKTPALFLPLLALPLLLAAPASAQEGSCRTPDATEEYKTAYKLVHAGESTASLEHFDSCLQLDPKCLECHYEVGWAYWTLAQWDNVIASWEKVLELDPDNKAVTSWMPQAKDNQRGARTPLTPDGIRVPLGITSKPADSPIKLTLAGRFQNYRTKTPFPDVHDEDVFSPKSARFTPDGSKVYVNSLEGKRTIVYDPKEMKKLGVILHMFDEDDARYFVDGETTVFDYPYYTTPKHGNLNRFKGKPVESAISNGGKYLWIPHYRRDWDYGARSPSAVTIIDTTTDEIVRVMPTGPIPKYIAVSPDGKLVSVTHWGDNTVALIDVSSGDARSFEYLPDRLVVEGNILNQKSLTGNRDAQCGFCLRGTTFTPDSKHLLVARMGDNGIAGFDVATGKYLGTLLGTHESPRHLEVKDGWLYFSSSSSGYVSRMRIDKVLEHLNAANGQRVKVDGWETVYVGGGARTIELSPDGKWIYTAVNGKAEVVVVRASDFQVVSRIRADSYTVGLGLSPDGKQLWTTSQGRGKRGGNSVCIYDIEVSE